MEVKNLFDPEVKQEIIERLNRLTSASQRKWGKMDVAQMLAHCQAQMGVAIGRHQLKSNFFIRLLAPLAKKMVYSDKPFSKNLPTDKSFKIADHREFEKERQQIIGMINDFSEENIVNEVHPFFGKLTKEQWSRGTWKHLDHHLQQFGV